MRLWAYSFFDALSCGVALKETDPFKLYETQASEDAATAHAAYEQWVCENSYANLTTPKHYQEVTGADYSWKPGYAIPK